MKNSKGKLIFLVLLLNLGEALRASRSRSTTGVQKTSMKKLFHDLAVTRKNKESMVVLFYSPNCGHCKEFEKKYMIAAKNLYKKKNKKLKFFKANCQNNPNLIVAFKIKFFPYLVYFHDGIPKTKMPLLLTNSKGLTEQWIDMIDSKFRPQKNKFRRAKKKGKGTSLKSQMRAIDQEYASMVGLASTGYHKYQKQLKNQLFGHQAGNRYLARSVPTPKPDFQFSSSGDDEEDQGEDDEDRRRRKYTQAYFGE